MEVKNNNGMNIYKITNLVNGKVYIGKEQKYDPEYFGSGLIIRRSINKYGIKNFKKEIIEECSSVDNLNEREQHWISKCNSMAPNGYNISKGGNGGDIFTTHPDKEKLRALFKIIHKGERNGMYGKTHTAKSKRLISRHKKGQRKGIATWNKGKEMSDKFKEERSEKYSGEGNPKAKTFLFISPNGE